MVAEISWTKNVIIMSKCKDDPEKEFYIKMTKKFDWTKNVLIHQIENQSYEKYLLILFFFFFFLRHKMVAFYNKLTYNIFGGEMGTIFILDIKPHESAYLAPGGDDQ